MKTIDGVQFVTVDESSDPALTEIYANAIKRTFGEDAVVMWGDDETIRVERNNEVFSYQIGSDDDTNMYFFRQPEHAGDQVAVTVTLTDDDEMQIVRTLVKRG